MSEKIPQTEIDRIKTHHNLKDIIGQDVIWANEGRSYGGTLKGPCPFCGGQDRFHAHPKDGNWWCRQCGRKGDIFAYWMQRYKISFSEAYRALALGAGIEESKANPVSPKPTPEPDPVYLACQSASYPITFEWSDGTQTTYHDMEEAYNDLWARSMVKETQALGEVVGESVNL